jgi:drug/metabolite transporter (DMT)-like permease
MFSVSVIYLLVLVTTFFWGANFVLAGYVLADFSPNWSAAIRFTSAAVLLLLVARWQGAALGTLFRRHAGIYLLLGLVGIACFNLLFFYAMLTTSANNAALIMATNPLITTLLAFGFLGERMSWNGLLALPVALLGVLVVVTGGNLDSMREMQFVAGDGLMLLANICWAMYNILGRRFMPTASPVANTALIVASGALVLSVLALWHDGFGTLTMPSADGAMAMLVFVLGGTVFAYLFWNMGIARLGASRTALFMNVVPVFAFLSAMVIGEYPTSAQLTGGAIVLAGLLLSIAPLGRKTS